jgi:phage antirepressor YoqD-like protein
LGKILIIVIYIVLTLIATCVIYLILNKFPDQLNDIQKLILSPILATLVSVIVSFFKANKSVIKIFSHSEKKLYTFLRYHKFLHSISNIFIPEFISYDISTLEKQTSAINKAKNEIVNSNHCVILIEGEAGKGKTSVIYYLFDIIGKNTEKDCITAFDKLYKNSIYIDCSLSERSIKDFISNYKSSHYLNRYIFIDKIENLSEQMALEFYQNIISPYINIKDNKLNASLLVLITEINAQMNSNQNYLINQMKQSKLIYTFHLDDKIIVNNTGNNYIDYLSEEINNSDNDIIRLHYHNLMNAKKIPPYLNDMISCNRKQENNDIILVFIAIIAYSSYNALFNIKELLELIQHYNNLHKVKTNRRKLKEIVNELNKVRFIHKFPLKKDFYSFGQILSKHYRKRINNNQVLSNMYNEYMSVLYQKELKINNERNYVLLWLFLISNSKQQIINESNRDKIFYEALAQGNFQYMLNELKFNIALNPEKENIFDREFGVLNEKVGNRIEAQTYLNRFINDSNQNNDEKNQMKLFIFEANHGKNPDKEIVNEIISTTSNMFIKFQAEYWIEHINIERGTFNYEKFESLVSKIIHNKQWQNEFNFAHVLRRVYSDYARLYYLIGNINKEKIHNIEVSMKNSPLSKLHAQYNTYYQLTIKAHYIHYDILFQLGIFKEYKYSFYDITDNCGDLQAIINMSNQMYNGIVDELKGINDKSWRVVLIRKQEVELMRADFIYSNIKEILIEFQKHSIRNDVDVHTAYVKCLLFKLEFINAFLKDDRIKDKPQKSCNEYLDAAYKIYEEYNNTYGLFRIDFLRLFLQFAMDIYNNSKANNKNYYLNSKMKQFISSLKVLTDKHKNYKREQYIYQYLSELQNLNMITLIDVIKFYPVVLQ